MYKTLKTGHLVYLYDLLHYHQPAPTLRSSSQLLLYQVTTRINFQSKVFSIMVPVVWNSLSPVTKSSATIATFKAHLKICCYQCNIEMLFQYYTAQSKIINQPKTDWK